METLHGLVAAQVRRTPEAIAVAGCGIEWTYSELYRRAARLAGHLRRLGVGPEALVGVCLERSPDAIASMLAVLQAGGAYVPLDPSHPRERLATVLEDGGVRVVITAERWAPRLPADGVRVLIDRDDLAGSDEAAEPAPAPDEEALAYVTYTSGSTGRPKGVQISHRAATHFVRAYTIRPGVGPQDVVPALTTLTFDVSVAEIFSTLAMGGRLEVIDREEAVDGRRLAARINGLNLTLMHATPTAWRLLLDAGWKGTGQPGLRAASGAEPLQRNLADALLACGVELWNVYGPTETTVYALGGRVDAGDGPVLLGEPFGAMRTYVVDPEGAPVAEGEAGELLISGPSLARGYLARPDLTAAAFAPDPFSGEPGGRLYRTGDLVRRHAGGGLVFLGRLDHQVKVRGFRIELGEIETVLQRHPAVKQCVVLVREEVPGDPRLVAYLTLQPGDRPAGGELRAFAARFLPDYMLPASFVFLAEMPLKPTGKIDRSALPAPPRERPELSQPYVAPRTPVEEELAVIWGDVVGLDGLGVRDDFFEVGGHSLLAVHVLTRVRERFGPDLPLAVLFRVPTVEKMAALLAEPDLGRGSHLISMAGGDKAEAPLFCVHGVGGHVFRLVQLARLLGSERPFFGIQGWADLDEIGHLASVEAMATRYVQVVREAQPEGPYLIAGYSMGGVVAWEMGRMLTAAGETVDFLGLIDCEVPLPQPPVDPSRISFEAALAQELGFEVSLEHLFALPPPERLGYVVAEGIRRKVLPEGFTEADARRYIQVFYVTQAALQRYTPGPWSGRATLFRTEEQAAAGPTLGWGPLCLGGVEVIDIPGDHVTLTRSPNVEVMAAAFSDSLRRVVAARRSGVLT